MAVLHADPISGCCQMEATESSNGSFSHKRPSLKRTGSPISLEGLPIRTSCSASDRAGLCCRIEASPLFVGKPPYRLACDQHALSGRVPRHRPRRLGRDSSPRPSPSPATVASIARISFGKKLANAAFHDDLIGRDQHSCARCIVSNHFAEHATRSDHADPTIPLVINCNNRVDIGRSVLGHSPTIAIASAQTAIRPTFASRCAPVTISAVRSRMAAATNSNGRRERHQQLPGGLCPLHRTRARPLEGQSEVADRSAYDSAYPQWTN